MIKTGIDIAEGLNEQQREAVMHPINYCTKIVAGAGTGKTQIISKRFVKLVNDLIKDGVEDPASRLLVITFTDKAANEMKGRITGVLKASGIDCLGQDLWISTFHSFCSRILRKHSIEANLSPSFKLGEDQQLKTSFENIIKKIKYGEFYIIENIEQIATSLGLKANILDVDSINLLRDIGDLDGIFDDIFNVIKKIKAQGLDAKEFMNKSIEATTKYSQTVENLPFKSSSKEEYAEAWGEALLKYKDDYCEFDVEAFDKLAGAKLILDKFGKRNGTEWGLATGFPENISKMTKIEIHLTQIIALVYAAYQYELERLDIVDFDDLINKTIQILKHNEILRIHYQKLFKHLIIDEFQDTNGSQLELIKLLLNNEDANITFVGDRKQSIYGFRFAQMENLEVLHNVIEDKYQQKYPGISLVTNYRSTSHVLSAVNHVTTEELNLYETLNPNPARTYESENKHVMVSSLTGFQDAYTHKICEAKYITSEILRLKKEEGANYKDFAVLVKSHAHADLIEKQLTFAGIPSIKRVNVGFFINPVIKNVLALMRLAKNIRDEIALARILKIKLSEHEIYKLKKLADAEILKVKSFEELKRINLSEKITYLIENNLFETLDIAEEVKKYIILIFKAVFTISTQKNLSLLQIYYKLTSEIKPYFELGGIEQYQAELDLRVFEKVIADYMQGDNYVSISNFLEYVDRVKEDRNFEVPSLAVKDVDAVQLLTIHASKGLEFPYVFITNIKNKSGGSGDKTKISFDLQYGNKPGFGVIIHKFKGKDTPKALVYKEIWRNPRDKNEARRLFYVAVSRAEKYLNILSFEPYGNNGGTKPVDYIQNMPSILMSDPTDVSEIVIERQELKPFILKPHNIQDAVYSVLAAYEDPVDFKMSFSQINTFSHCPNKYLLKYKFHYPELGDEKTSSAIGSIVHNLIYNSYMNHKEFSITEVPMFLIGIDLSVDDSLKIDKLYSSFLKSDYSPNKLLGKELYPERSFNFGYKINDVNVEFSGDIDMLVKNDDGTYSIVDFKTNKKIEKSLEDYYKQLYLYKTALENEGLKISNLSIINLTEETPKTFELNKNDIEIAKQSFEQDIKNIIKLSNKNVIPERSLNANCEKCGYKYKCSTK